jgi:hypothetical protein
MQLGSWSVEDALLMSWTPGHIWVAELVLPPGETPEYSMVVVTEDKLSVQFPELDLFCKRKRQLGRAVT